MAIVGSSGKDRGRPRRPSLAAALGRCSVTRSLHRACWCDAQVLSVAGAVRTDQCVWLTGSHLGKDTGRTEDPEGPADASAAAGVTKARGLPFPDVTHSWASRPQQQAHGE